MFDEYNVSFAQCAVILRFMIGAFAIGELIFSNLLIYIVLLRGSRGGAWLGQALLSFVSDLPVMTRRRRLSDWPGEWPGG